MDPAYVGEIEKARLQRIEGLRAENGWLSLVGLHWIDAGEHTFGAGPENAIVLPAGSAPDRAGRFVVERAQVRVVVEPGVELRIGEQPVTERVLQDDTTDEPDVLRLGRLSLQLLRRGDRLGIRVKDPQAPTRAQFHGIEFYPVDPAWRVQAAFERYPAPREVEVPTVLGTAAKMTSTGLLKFRLEGRELVLEPFQDSPDDPALFVIFKDATSGKETYGAGRYLASKLEGETAVLDFNLAYNPPCAFTSFATCPLPPRGNVLGLAVRAGEKAGAHP